jgi:ribosome maturation factor RimP
MPVSEVSIVMRGRDPRWEALERDIAALLEEEGYELVLMEVLGHPGRHILRLRIDKPGGVTLRDCERMSYRIGAFLDVVDPFPAAYRLEVSSPGVDRPLVKPRDFERFAGQRAQIAFVTAGGRKRTVVGTLRGWREAQVVVEVEGTEVLIPYEAIEAAHLKYDWDAEPTPRRNPSRSQPS